MTSFVPACSGWFQIDDGYVTDGHEPSIRVRRSGMARGEHAVGR